MSENKCPHCNMDKEIRNPSGFCDHLYYPESCDVCKEFWKNKVTKRLELAEKVDFKIIAAHPLGKVFAVFSENAIYLWGSEEDVRKFKEKGLVMEND